MNYRLNKFYARLQHTGDTTVVIDLNMRDVISSLLIGLEVTNSAASMTAHPVACLTKIEIVDGSDVLYSLDGYEAEALDWYDQGGKFRSNYNYALNGGNICRYIGINFGRWLWDKEYAFDPKRFTNPQLRISLDIDAGGNSGSSVYITCWANLFDEAVPSLKGFFTTKEVKEYSIASATHEYTDLPLDYPYRALYFRPFVAGTEPNRCVSALKLSEDQDKRVPFDCGVQEIERALLAKYPPVEEHYYYALNTSNRYLYVAPTTRVTAYGAVWAESAAAQDAAFYDGDGGRLKTIAADNPSNTQILVRGYVPHAVYEIPFGDKNDPADFYDVRRLGSLRLDITGAATATGYIFLQQVRPY